MASEIVLGSSPGSLSDIVSLVGSSTGSDEHIAVEHLLPCKAERICVIGAGYVGGPTAAVIAFNNPGISVTVVDRDSSRISQWKSRHLPVREPGLDFIVRTARDGAHALDGHVKTTRREPNLFFSSDVKGNIAVADVIFICVNTPTKEQGIGAGMAPNLFAFEAAVRSIAESSKAGAIVVEKSTVPCGTSQRVQDILSQTRPDEHFEVLSNPEFLAEGTAVNDLLHPNRVLIGSALTPSGIAAANILKDVYAAWVDPRLIVTVNVWSSELAKLVANAMLAQRISSINTISAICDATGADINDVSRVVGLDTRIGNQFLKAGIGFGGSCFKKDVLALSYLARSLHLPKVADYWTAVLDINDFQQDRFMKKIVEQLHGTLQGKKITILGYAFKQNTNDCRESPAINVVKVLSLENPREIAIFDYGCTPAEICGNVKEYLEPKSGKGALKSDGASVQAYSDVYEACTGASAVLILTPWDMFRYPAKIPAALTQEKDVDEQSVAETLSKICITDLDVLTALPSLVYKAARLLQEPLCPAYCQLCLSESSGLISSPRNQSPLDWHRVAAVMREPRHVFDGRNLVDPSGMKRLGFRVESLGRTNGGDVFGRGSRMLGRVPMTPS